MVRICVTTKKVSKSLCTFINPIAQFEKNSTVRFVSDDQPTTQIKYEFPTIKGVRDTLLLSETCLYERVLLKRETLSSSLNPPFDIKEPFTLSV